MRPAELEAALIDTATGLAVVNRFMVSLHQSRSCSATRLRHIRASHCGPRSFALWRGKASPRQLRRDFSPVELEFVLPNLQLLDVLPDCGLRFRLAGNTICGFSAPTRPEPPSMRRRRRSSPRSAALHAQACVAAGLRAR